MSTGYHLSLQAICSAPPSPDESSVGTSTTKHTSMHGSQRTNGSYGSVVLSLTPVRCSSLWQRTSSESRCDDLESTDHSADSIFFGSDSRDVSTSTTDYVVMQIDFPLDGPNPKPTFTTLSSFSIPGPVMNVFLLDPIQKLFAAFIFLGGPQDIGLYCLPNWDKPEYIFIDTCIQCVSPFPSE